MECFSVKFISPYASREFSDVVALTIRVSCGELVIMANHENAVMSLLSHAVLLKSAGANEVKAVVVSNAVFSMENNICSILADMVVFPENVESKEKLLGLRIEVQKLADYPGLVGELAREDLEFIDKVLKG